MYDHSGSIASLTPAGSLNAFHLAAQGAPPFRSRNRGSRRRRPKAPIGRSNNVPEMALEDKSSMFAEQRQRETTDTRVRQGV